MTSNEQNQKYIISKEELDQLISRDIDFVAKIAIGDRIRERKNVDPLDLLNDLALFVNDINSHVFLICPVTTDIPKKAIRFWIDSWTKRIGDD